MNIRSYDRPGTIGRLSGEGEGEGVTPLVPKTLTRSIE